MSRAFESRGDPLVSPKEGQKDFGRNLETENPDMDRYFARLATDLLKPGQIDKTNEGKKRSNAFLTGRKGDDAQRRATNNILAAKKKVNEAIRKAEGIHSERQKEMFKEPRDAERVEPDNLPKTKHERVTQPKWQGATTSREEQTPPASRGTKSYYDFSGKLPPKEIKKYGKIYKRR